MAEEFVISAEEIQEYFFNFKDQYSFHLCRLLKNEEVSIARFEKVILEEQKEQFIAVVLKYQDQKIAVIKDLKTQKFFKYYLKGLGDGFGMTFVRPFQGQEDRVFVVYTGQESLGIEDDGEIRNSKVYMFELDQEKFIHSAENMDEGTEISSVIKWVREKEEFLIDNDEFGREASGILRKEVFGVNDPNFSCDIKSTPCGIVVNRFFSGGRILDQNFENNYQSFY